jgi:hypothetical protein
MTSMYIIIYTNTTKITRSHAGKAWPTSRQFDVIRASGAPWLNKYFDPTLCMKLTGESQSLNADQAILPSQTC